MLVQNPIKINSVSLCNRVVLPPMCMRLAEDNGGIGAAVLDHYAEKTEGGYIGLAIVEHCYVNVQGKASARQISAADDDSIPGLQALADVLHRNGCKALVQINHAGTLADGRVSGLPLVGPCVMPNPRKDMGMPKALSKAEISEIVNDFCAAAVRVQKAGFDGVEIHSAHGYLLNQFLSPLSNKRTDEYGGEEIVNRIRVHLEIVRAVRSAVGDAFPILVRLGAADYIEGGTVIEQSVGAALALEQAGVDAIDVSGGFCMYTIPGCENTPGYFAPLSEAIKGAVNIPVILTGGIKKVRFAEELLQAAKADLIGVGRAILQDSNWAKNEFGCLA